MVALQLAYCVRRGGGGGGGLKVQYQTGEEGGSRMNIIGYICRNYGASIIIRIRKA